jgi:YggT family protein
MQGGYGTQAIQFLIQTIFSMYLVAIMLRILLQMTRADFYNPVSQFLVKVTNPPLIPLRRIIPGFMGIDMAAVLLLLVVMAAELFLIVMINGGSITISGLIVIAIANLFDLLLDVYFYSILIQVIISWINPGSYNPVVSLLYSINEPLLGRARRLIPPISGFDFSPIVVVILLKLIGILLVQPIAALGRSLAVG